jgi:hypothetical protein
MSPATSVVSLPTVRPVQIFDGSQRWHERETHQVKSRLRLVYDAVIVPIFADSEAVMTRIYLKDPKDPDGVERWTLSRKPSPPGVTLLRRMICMPFEGASAPMGVVGSMRRLKSSPPSWLELVNDRSTVETMIESPGVCWFPPLSQRGE